MLWIVVGLFTDSLITSGGNKSNIPIWRAYIFSTEPLQIKCSSEVSIIKYNTHLDRFKLVLLLFTINHFNAACCRDFQLWSISSLSFPWIWSGYLTVKIEGKIRNKSVPYIRIFQVLNECHWCQWWPVISPWTSCTRRRRSAVLYSGPPSDTDWASSPPAGMDNMELVKHVCTKTSVLMLLIILTVYVDHTTHASISRMIRCRKRCTFLFIIEVWLNQPTSHNLQF